MNLGRDFEAIAIVGIERQIKERFRHFEVFNESHGIPFVGDPIQHVHKPKDMPSQFVAAVLATRGRVGDGQEEFGNMRDPVNNIECEV